MLSDGSGSTRSQESSEPDAQARAPARPDDITITREISTAVTTDRTYECLDCGFVVDSFLGPCPGCGSTAFETTTSDDGGGSATPFEPFIAATATLTAPVNPYVPR